jgi:epoxyqueuosine reductase
METGIKEKIVAKAKEFGACAAGIANVEALQKSPSNVVYNKIGDYRTVGNKAGQMKPGEVSWPLDAKSAVVIALEHIETKPEMDWWIADYPGGTPGNRMLIAIQNQLASWLKEYCSARPLKVPYHIEEGGILIKDAAVLAGLGCLGKNNMLVTPEFGPRVRLRAIFTDIALPDTGPVDFDPCENCDMPCRTVCPQNAFAERIYSEMGFGISQLPARTGVYSRPLCNRQMVLDEGSSKGIRITGENRIKRTIMYCRLCEFSCPVGKPAK